MTFNESIDKFFRMTLWIWLPFYAFGILFREARERFHEKK